MVNCFDAFWRFYASARQLSKDQIFDMRKYEKAVACGSVFFSRLKKGCFCPSQHQAQTVSELAEWYTKRTGLPFEGPSLASLRTGLKQIALRLDSAASHLYVLYD